MPTPNLRLRAALLACTLACPLAVQAAAPDDAGVRTAALLDHGFWIEPNVTYLTASGKELKLDVYRPMKRSEQALPVMLHFHGGGWVAGSRESSAFALLPYLQMGFTVVNVSYRLANVALAPAAVEDTLCALQWVGRNAKKYNFDLAKVVTTGDSAGGHLALATAMIPSDSPLTRQCAANEPSWSGPYQNPAPKVAAVINWYGITDVADMLQGPNQRSYAVAWFGSMPGRETVARAVSPMTYVRAGGPAVFTIHGDADPLVPYAHGVRLKNALDGAGVKNLLHTIKGGGHGGFTAEQHVGAYAAAHAFLQGLAIVPPSL
ncbi:alpha/beta hydrolase [Telluria aromaticivorans]|uniref:Alpha/beta hydrolase n=1 Tax=Telluria aromaticivorans TaxID=2725995 RepID=A0A7Y2NYV3_9BURK|nr:alpha/beta hydrolase [Telluria aromaticivorans]NNG21881.1 alpha/beta hydrolase [Telluria aromaticivorans]